MHGGPRFFPDGIFSLVNKLPGLGGAGSNDGGWIFGTDSQPAGFRTIRIDAFDQYVIQHSTGDDIIKRYNRSFEWTNDANKSLVYPRDKASNPCIYYPEWASAVTLGIWWSRASVFLGAQVCAHISSFPSVLQFV